MQSNKKILRARRSGMAMFSVTVMIGGLAILGALAYTVTRTDIAIVKNHRMEATAFAAADGGVNYVRAKIEADIASGAVNFNSNILNIAVNYAAPTGYNFDTVTNITRSSTGSYSFTVLGRESNAVASITTAWSRGRAMNYGVFGCSSVDMKASGFSYSYYSTDFSGGSNPSSSDSTSEADEATDGLFTTHVGTYIDGDLVLGATTSGTPAVWTDPGAGSTIVGESGINVGNVDCDPLGASSGSLAAQFAAGTPTAITVGNGKTLTLTSGNYYFSSIDMKEGSTLLVKATNGPVNIYLSGSASFKNSGAINPGGQPTDFNLFSNSSATITVANSAEFKGLIYAPKAWVDMKNSGDVYGVIWGTDVTIRNSANMFVDLSLLNKFQSSRLSLISWKANRGG